MDDHIDSFLHPILGNGVAYEKIDIPQNEEEKTKRYWSIANYRYMAGKILWDLMEQRDKDP